MPGNVSNAAPATVLPQSLCTAFQHSRSYPVRANEYADGTAQRDVLALSSRKIWQLAKRLTATDLATLRDFYEARGGTKEAFYFYDPYNPGTGSAVGSNYDPTGTETQGRHVVCFTGDWAQNASGPGRLTVDIGLRELA